MIEKRFTINGMEVDARYSESAVSGIFLPLLKKLTDLQHAKGRRILAMLAAPPGAGKTTLLNFLEVLSREQADLEEIQVIGMDGFHRRQDVLVKRMIERDGQMIPMVRIKGAPVTFDLELLTERLKRVAAGENCGWPLYNRLLHNPVENALTVDRSIVLIEGNYFLLDEPGWRSLAKFANYTVSIKAEESFLRDRLIDRRIRSGVPEDAAIEFVDFSDMPNVRLCLERSGPADLQLTIDADGEYHVYG